MYESSQKKASWVAILGKRPFRVKDSRFLMVPRLPLIYGHRTHSSHEEPSTRVLRGQANNDAPPMARTEEARTGDRNDNDNRVDAVLSGNGDSQIYIYPT
jgi:hypothetical protein